MIIQIKKDLQNQYIGYVLAGDWSKQVLYVGIRHYSQLLNLEPHEQNKDLILRIIMYDTNHVTLYNNFKQWCKLSNLSHLVNDSQMFKKKQVVCVDTGETFTNPTEATKVHNLSYDALLKHLKGFVGYKSVKGKKYKYIVDKP